MKKRNSSQLYFGVTNVSLGNGAYVRGPWDSHYTTITRWGGDHVLDVAEELVGCR